MTSKMFSTARFFFCCIILCFVCSCTPQKRLANLVKRHPELLRDTMITDIDTTFINIPAVHTDSVVHINTFKTDTIIIQKDRLRIKTYVYKDSVFIEGECMGIKDTIVSIEEIRVPYVVNQQEKFPWWKWVVLGVIAYFVFKELRSWKRTSQSN